MDILLNEKIDPKTLMEFERKYKQEEAMGTISTETKFEYAWCLIRSSYSDDWKIGCRFLEELCYKCDALAKRDYLFYMAIGQYKLKNYDVALEHCKTILQFQPDNAQVLELKNHIDSQLKKEGIVGMAVAGGATLVVGAAAAGLAAFLATRFRR